MPVTTFTTEKCLQDLCEKNGNHEGVPVTTKCLQDLCEKNGNHEGVPVSKFTTEKYLQDLCEKNGNHEGVPLTTKCLQDLCEKNGTSSGTYTVTRPYAGFRYPDRMAPDQTVRGGENDFFIWSGNFLAQVAQFSSIFPKPGLFRRFT